MISGGAAQALVGRLQDRCALPVEGTFGAVGAMRDKLLAGQPCDVLILTQALIDALAAQGHVRRDTAAALGVVKTGVAVKAGEARPDVSTPDALKAALQRAPGIYFPDPEKATAGIHFMKVLRALGIDAELRERIRTFPNGATALGKMAQAPEPGVIGCTQVTEILHVPGVELVALLPRQFELATVYTAAVCTQAQSPAAAEAFVRLLAGSEAAPDRAACGFEA
ncbi:substrate-binding domain-containing protein [Ramlibacter solisilvae]